MSKTHASVDVQAAAVAVRDLLIAVGENPDRDGLSETPARVAHSYAELLRGYLRNFTGYLSLHSSRGLKPHSLIRAEKRDRTFLLGS